MKRLDRRLIRKREKAQKLREHKRREREEKQRERQMVRQQKQREREMVREKKRRAQLIELLEEFIKSHYGNPSKGKVGAILYGPTIAMLSAASTLFAFLRETTDATPAKQKPKSKKHGRKR